MDWELLGIALIGIFYLCYRVSGENSPIWQKNKNGRDTTLDQLRGLAMIGIVCIHIHSYFSFFHPKDTQILTYTLLFSNLSRFSVPLFIFASSLFLSKKEGYWLNKGKSLVLPYLLASCIGYFVKYSNLSLLDLSAKILFGEVFTPYYFVPLLFQFYLLYYFLFLEKWNYLSLVLVSILSLIVNFLSNLGLLDELLPKQYHAISIFNYIGFFFLGILLKNSKNSNSLPKQALISYLLPFTISMGVLIIFYSYKHIDLKNHHLGYPILMVLFLREILASQSVGKMSKFLGFVGKNSLYIFLIHPFVIHYMHAIDPYFFFNPLVGYLITLILNIGIPTLIAYLITYRSQTFAN
ncbi:acyltransferase family protein [Leptospira ryugenii]|uniref:acyltransferase family protein n=1 Tax=Leptospira ryugenii TaxID=1917863 RepID=UPI000D5A1032|nr:acyltransferase [Leptospira ryugenii]